MHRGDILGDRFEIDEHVASGGMGQVFRAHDVHTGQVVAVKMLLGDVGSNAARFEHEARALSELQHPGIVRYVAHGITASGEPYLAMEWLNGETLAMRLRRGMLKIDESIELAIHVAEALGAAHARSIVHRDLKPSNIFLLGERVDQAKLLDFGIAQLRSVTRITQTDTILGTPGYIAPELVQTDRPVDARADVFSLGCVLFECLTGAPAFHAEQIMALLAKVVFAETPRLCNVRPDAPKDLEALLSRMLAKNPAQRPSDGEAVAEALFAIGLKASAGVSSRPVVALTRGEQRTIAMILVAGEGKHEINDDRTLDLTEPDVEHVLQRGAETYGGRLDQLHDGSVIVAIGGTGLATDQAAQAARCALWLRKHTGRRPMALATGRGDITARVLTAEAIDRAAKLLTSSPLAEDVVAIDEVTARLLDERFDVREIDTRYILQGERELAEATRTLLGKATPCVGRDLELRRLEQLFEECVEEPSARAVIVTAPPGTGKSRLGREFLSFIKAREQFVSVWIGRGDPLRAGSAFSLLAQILRNACGIYDGEALDVRRQKILTRVAACVDPDQQQQVAEFLGEIAGVPFPDENSLRLRAARKDAQIMNDRVRTAVVDFLRAECQLNPVLLMLEDLHWGDRPTVQFLHHALRDLGETPIFVFALARPEVQELFQRFWTDKLVHEMQLKQLGKKASERLVRYILGDTASPDTVDRLVRLSEGNAFYLEELIRATAEGQSGDLPETAVAMVQSRLGALEDSPRRILRAAAVFGETFWAGAVAQLLGVAGPTVGVTPRLEQLVQREFILKRKQSRFPDEDEYAFRHALLREGAYTMLTHEDRSLGHRLAGEWLEQHGEQDALTLAEHFERGGEGARAGQHYLRVAEQAHWGGDSEGSIAGAKRGLACAVPDDLRVRLLGILSEAHHFNTALLLDGLPYAEEVVRLAQRGSTPWSQGTVVKLTCSIRAGQLKEFAALTALLKETVPVRGAAGPWAFCFAISIHLLDLGGSPRVADTFVNQLDAVVQTLGDEEPTAQALLHAVLAYRTAYAYEDPWKAIQQSHVAFELSNAIGHRRFAAGTKIFMGMNQWHAGKFHDVERLMLDVPLSDEQIGMSSAIRPFTLAWLHADCGTFDQARKYAIRLIESGQSRQLRLDEGRGRWALAEVLRRAGELDGADAEIQAAIAMLSIVSPLDTPGALATMAALRLAQGRAAEALVAAEQGLAKYTSMGACGFFRGSFLHLTHAECLNATGNHEAACAAIAQARQRLFAIADKIDNPNDRNTFFENVPENRKTLDLVKQWLR